MTDYILIHLNTDFPPGLSKAQHHDMQMGYCLTIGLQTALQPAQVTHGRPNVPTTHLYDEGGNEIGIDEVATDWLVAGDFSNEGWPNDAAIRSGIAEALGEYLGIDFPPPKLEVQKLTPEEVLQVLSNEAEFWGEA